MNISGKTVLVAEETGGLGKKTAAFLEEHGAAVYYMDKREEDLTAAVERIIKEKGRLDLLVNNLGDAMPSCGFGAGLQRDNRLEALSMSRLDAFFAPWLRTACRVFYYALPHMMKERTGLIVTLACRTMEEEFDDIIYEAANAAVCRMTRAMAVVLARYGIAAVTLQPGAVRPAQNDAPGYASDMACAESPELTGRAVAALASDSDIMIKSGKLLTTAGVAREYGFLDIDGRKPAITRRQLRALIPVR